MFENTREGIQAELREIDEAGLTKSERIITSPQRALITTSDGKEVLNFCANNYLGLSDHPALIDAVKEFTESKLHHLWILDDFKPSGIMSLTDLMKIAAASSRDCGEPTSSRASPSWPTASPTTSTTCWSACSVTPSSCAGTSTPSRPRPRRSRPSNTRSRGRRS